MKKIVSVFLVALFLLNVMGYYGLFLGLEYKNSMRVTDRINGDVYDESETITLKIPLVVPYYGDTEFERVDGEIEHEGEFYRLVKQKLEKDTLHVVCIRDTRAKHIHKALADYVSTFADQSADRSAAKTIPSFIKDYFPSSFCLLEAAYGWGALVTYYAPEAELSEGMTTDFFPPPKA